MLTTQSSTQELPSEEYSENDDDVEPGWVWTPPTNDDIRHYTAHMQAIKEA